MELQACGVYHSAFDACNDCDSGVRRNPKDKSKVEGWSNEATWAAWMMLSTSKFYERARLIANEKCTETTRYLLLKGTVLLAQEAARDFSFNGDEVALPELAHFLRQQAKRGGES